MPRIKMLKSTHGADDGFTVRRYEKDVEYEVSESLAKTFVGEGVAKRIDEEKAIEAAPENKAEKAPKNKAQK